MLIAVSVASEQRFSAKTLVVRGQDTAANPLMHIVQTGNLTLVKSWYCD